MRKEITTMNATPTINAAKRTRTAGCPACSHTLAFHVEGRIYRCAHCEAIYGDCYLGDSYKYVLPLWTSQEVPSERLRYYDFTCLGSQGVSRRHGWYDTESKCVVQVG
jgi:ribosomal protein L37AE/L43A